jgi:hypothetical protein
VTPRGEASPSRDATAAPSSTDSRAVGRDRAGLAAGAAVFLALLACSTVWRRHGLIAPAVAVLVATTMAAILRAARVDGATVGVVLAGLGLEAVYFGWTSALQRNLDAPSQLFYINYLIEHHALPPNGACTTCHHPPLFYLAFAAARRLLELMRVTDVVSGLQACAHAVFAVFLLFSTLAIDRLAPRPSQKVLATALVAFWPYTVINSVRIHNDVGLYAVAAVAFYFLVVWAQDGGRRPLALACAVVLVGLFVKTNAAVLVLLAVAVVGYRALHAGDRRAVVREAAPFVALLVLLTAGHGLVRGEHRAGLATRLLGAPVAEEAPARTPRSLRYYLTFDPRTAVAPPFAITCAGRSLEPSYWNHLVKSSLFGTRNAWVQQTGPVDAAENTTVALAANCALLALLAALLGGLVLTLRDSCAARTLALLAAATWTLGGLAFHLMAPAGHHADFRLIYPIVVPLSVLYAHGAEGVRRRRRWLRRALTIVAGVFIALSVAYFVPVTARVVPLSPVHPGRDPFMGLRRPGRAPPTSGPHLRRPLIRPPAPASQLTLPR